MNAFQSWPILSQTWFAMLTWSLKFWVAESRLGRMYSHPVFVIIVTWSFLFFTSSFFCFVLFCFVLFSFFVLFCFVFCFLFFVFVFLFFVLFCFCFCFLFFVFYLALYDVCGVISYYTSATQRRSQWLKHI